MKLLSCTVSNFGSYKELEFDFSDQGLTLIHGPTGSGKSTLLDICSWVLYSVTAKRGSVEEVRSWQAGGESTIGKLILLVGATQLTVCRTRGGAGRNDLFWIESGDPTREIRGKDLNDTQKLLEARLSISADCFLASSYYHEFSPTAAFFTAKAKDRRELFEHVCDLSFPTKLSDRCIEEKRKIKDSIASCSGDLSELTGLVQAQTAHLVSLTESRRNWEVSRERRISDFRRKAETFETEKSNKIKTLQAKSQAWEQEALVRIDKISDRISHLDSVTRPLKDLELEEARVRNETRCKSCGALPENLAAVLESVVSEKLTNIQNMNDLKRSKKELSELGKAVNPYAGTLDIALQEVNNHSNMVQALEAEQNPFTGQLEALQETLYKGKASLKSTQDALSKHKHRCSSIEHLYELSFELRGTLINSAIQDIEKQTNRYLEDYFDAELRVDFESKDADNLELRIQKSGYSCTYAQLSKGQRQMLRLSFCVSVMNSTADNAGIHFSHLFFDESLDGLSVELKLKAYRLFEELSKSHSVLIVDHSQELGMLFNKKYHVSLCGDYSKLELEANQ